MRIRGSQTSPSSALPPAVSDCLAAIERRIEGDVRGDLYSRVLYSTDASIYQVMPLGVVLPRSSDDVHATVEAAVEHGVPVPGMSSALAYYDSYRAARLPANLLQAQRDFFGAHTYRRVDKPADRSFHTNWQS